MNEQDKSIDPAVFIRARLRRPVVLVGIMGSGKTAIGRRLADRLGLEFRDSDKKVEEKAGCTINEIFEEFGEEKFRHAERNTILEILADGPCVLATGGGAIVNNETRKAIKSKALSVWLKAEIPEILKRLENTDDRPLLKNGNPEKTLRDLMSKREPFYAEADIHIESNGRQPDETLGILINALCQHLENDMV